MALEGDLEDLNIRDILQLISLSKKTGTLTLTCRQVEGLVCFSSGQIIRASSTLFPQGLGQLLRGRNVITEEQIDQALNYQRKLEHHQPLGQIFVDLFKIPKTVIEEVVAEQIEKIVLSFFTLNEGRFSFHLEELKSFGSALLNPLDFMLDKGLSPQRLAIKGKQIVDQGEAVDDDSIDRELEALNVRQHQQGIELLRGMLAELEHPEFGGGIILLILRYASEIMKRAIVFDVRGHLLVGLGQFGLDRLDDSVDDIVRKMRLQVSPDSLFAQVLRQKTAIRSVLRESEAEKYLQTFLTGGTNEVFLAPLINDGHVVALLYGDSFLNSQAERSLDAFEVFLEQAGIAMEQALQERIAV